MQVHHFLWEDVSTPHRDFRMKMLLSPSSHNELFILNIIIIILFLTERQGGTPLPARLGPSGSPPQPPDGRPGRRRGVTRHLCPPVRPGPVNGRTAARKFTGRCAPSQPEAISGPSRTSGVSNCTSQGPSAVSRTHVCPCGIPAGGLKGRSSLESSS